MLKTNTMLNKTKKRRVKSPLQKAKDRLWQLCRELTFLEHGRACYTCGNKTLSGSGLHCGHFITDSTCSTYMSYNLGNLRPQCYACNINKSGNWIEFEKRLREDVGHEAIEALKQTNERTKGLKYDILWYNAKIEEYTELLKSKQAGLCR